MTANQLDKWDTWREIHAQPAIWKDWADAFDPGEVSDWIAAQDFDQIWLSGAGTSAYIGDIISAGLEGQSDARIRSVPTTDIVSRPHAFLKNARPLIVNFGRSGDSAETIGVLNALDVLAPTAPRLNITCNAAGALATRVAPGPQKVILLPEATHDAGFAMTSSFSTMLLTALAVLQPDADFETRMNALAGGFDRLVAGFTPEPRPDRAVFLGTGPLAFAAREASLKVLELTAGNTQALWDTTLGFRHGPKSFVDDRTAIFLFLSNDLGARRYEDDLANELRAQFPNSKLTTLGPGGDIDPETGLCDLWSVPVLVAHAQMLAVHWSAALGLNVDAPFEGQGTLTRVVSGVTLYEVRP